MHAILAFDPISCAVAMSLLEHAACSLRPSRVCCRAKVWLRRAPETILDAALNEVAEPTLDALNALDHFYYSFLSAHRGGDVAVLCVLVFASVALGWLCAVLNNKRL